MRHTPLNPTPISTLGKRPTAFEELSTLGLLFLGLLIVILSKCGSGERS
jgi:hypothetical protein